MTTRDTTAEFINKITRTWGASKKLVVTAAALLLLSITIVAVVRQAPVPATRVPICVKNNGQLRMLAGNNTACDPSEQLTEWVVGGQITDIRLGQGLVGSRDNGIVSLDLDPAILQNCAGCGRIFAGFDDGPREVPNLVFGEEQPPIAKLELPAGNYAIFAKLVVRTKEFENVSFTSKGSVLCKLSAGDDFDRSSALLEEHDDRPIEAIEQDEVVVSLEVVHRFTQPGEAVLRCSKGLLPASGVIMEFTNLKIIALEGSGISNVFLGNN
jgi:hypothetical protein